MVSWCVKGSEGVLTLLTLTPVQILPSAYGG